MMACSAQSEPSNEKGFITWVARGQRHFVGVVGYHDIGSACFWVWCIVGSVVRGAVTVRPSVTTGEVKLAFII